MSNLCQKNPNSKITSPRKRSEIASQKKTKYSLLRKEEAALKRKVFKTMETGTTMVYNYSVFTITSSMLAFFSTPLEFLTTHPPEPNSTLLSASAFMRRQRSLLRFADITKTIQSSKNGLSPGNKITL